MLAAVGLRHQRARLRGWRSTQSSLSAVSTPEGALVKPLAQGQSITVNKSRAATARIRGVNEKVTRQVSELRERSVAV
jgi:hypothetical protein